MLTSCDSRARERPYFRVFIVGRELHLIGTRILLNDLLEQRPRPADIPEFANIQIEVIVQPAVAQTLLERLAKDFFPRYGMVAFESDVRVLRPGKF